jgi:signal peptide peptidase SppA
MLHNRVLTTLRDRIWALTPEKLQEVADFVAARLEGRDTGFELKQLMGQDNGADSKPYTVRDSVAVIPAFGVMDRRLNLFQAISGGTSSEILSSWIRDAAADPRISAIVLDIDSPGGSVFAPVEVAAAVQAARLAKPVTAFSGGQVSSAAYWIAAQADRIVVSSTAVAGSIGVAMVHYDYSRRDEAAGVKRTVITAGDFKRVGADNAPLSDRDLGVIRSQLEHYYGIFVNAVAEGRGVPAAEVMERMADGRIFIGTQAVEAGLADEIGNLEDALELARENTRRTVMDLKGKPAAAGGQGEGQAQGEGQVIEAREGKILLTADTVKAEYADIAAALAKEGADAERVRVVDILEAGGKPELALQAIKDGVTATDFFKSVLAADVKAKEEAKTKLEQDLGKGSAGASGKDKGAGGQDFMAVVAERAKADKITKTAAMKLVAAEQPALHAAFLAKSAQDRG